MVISALPEPHIQSFNEGQVFTWQMILSGLLPGKSVPHSALLGALVAQVPVQTGCIQAKVLGATSYLFSMGV